jgi:hypothetical protein
MNIRSRSRPKNADGFQLMEQHRVLRFVLQKKRLSHLTSSLVSLLLSPLMSTTGPTVTPSATVVVAKIR